MVISILFHFILFYFSVLSLSALPSVFGAMCFFFPAHKFSLALTLSPNRSLFLLGLVFRCLASNGTKKKKTTTITTKIKWCFLCSKQQHHTNSTTHEEVCTQYRAYRDCKLCIYFNLLLETIVCVCVSFSLFKISTDLFSLTLLLTVRFSFVFRLVHCGIVSFRSNYGNWQIANTGKHTLGGFFLRNCHRV